MTPYASMLQTIMDMHNKYYVKCPGCDEVFIPEGAQPQTKIKKVICLSFIKCVFLLSNVSFIYQICLSFIQLTKISCAELLLT